MVTGPPPGLTMTGMRHGKAMTDERALRASIDALLRDYPWATRERVEQLLSLFYERTSEAKVTQYRVLLAERDTRVQLRREERARRDDFAISDSLTRQPRRSARSVRAPR